MDVRDAVPDASLYSVVSAACDGEDGPVRFSELFPRDLNGDFVKGRGKRPDSSVADPTKPLAVAACNKAAEQQDLQRLQVNLRVKPPPAVGAGAGHGEDISSSCCLEVQSGTGVAVEPPKGSQGYRNGDQRQTFAFERVFDHSTSQEAFFNAVAAEQVSQSLHSEQHECVFMAYGQTSAGKTYTIEGNKSSPGLLPRALDLMFHKAHPPSSCDGPSTAAAAQGGGNLGGVAGRGYRFTVSYYEVYNDNVFDLLTWHPSPAALGGQAGGAFGGGAGLAGEAAGGGGAAHAPGDGAANNVGGKAPRVPLRVKEDARGKVFVAGLRQVEIGSAAEGLEALRRGSRQRQRAATGMNQASSRSHSVFTVHVHRQVEAPLDLLAEPPQQQPATASQQQQQQHEEVGGELRCVGKVSFVDLAGAERQGRTGNEGARLRESVAINNTLSTLGACLKALCWNQAHKGGEQRLVPYRESKVTHLFRDILHGYGQLVLCVAVSPAAKDYDETIHVLKYAAMATQISAAPRLEAPSRVLRAKTPNVSRRKPRASAAAVVAGGGKDKGQAARHQPQLQAIEESDEAVDEPAPRRARRNRSGGDATAAAAAAAAAAPSPTGTSASSGREQRLADSEEVTRQLRMTVEVLHTEVERLQDELHASAERFAAAEAEVREEVTAEMSEMARELEERYKQRLAEELAAMERRYKSAAAAAVVAASPAAAAAAGAAAARRAGGGKYTGPRLYGSDEVLASIQEQEVDVLQAQVAEYRTEAKRLAEALQQARESSEEQEGALREQLALATGRLAALERDLLEQRQAAATAAPATEVAAQVAAAKAEFERQVTQIKANHAMELELLERQLELQRAANESLARRLEKAVDTALDAQDRHLLAVQQLRSMSGGGDACNGGGNGGGGSGAAAGAGGVGAVPKPEATAAMDIEGQQPQEQGRVAASPEVVAVEEVPAAGRSGAGEGCAAYEEAEGSGRPLPSGRAPLADLEAAASPGSNQQQGGCEEGKRARRSSSRRRGRSSCAATEQAAATAASSGARQGRASGRTRCSAEGAAAARPPPLAAVAEEQEEEEEGSGAAAGPSPSTAEAAEVESAADIAKGGKPVGKRKRAEAGAPPEEQQQRRSLRRTGQASMAEAVGGAVTEAGAVPPLQRPAGQQEAAEQQEQHHQPAPKRQKRRAAHALGAGPLPPADSVAAASAAIPSEEAEQPVPAPAAKAGRTRSSGRGRRRLLPAKPMSSKYAAAAAAATLVPPLAAAAADLDAPPLKHFAAQPGGFEDAAVAAARPKRRRGAAR